MVQLFFYSLKVDAKLYYKYGFIFREVLATPKLDWCNLMKNGMDNLIVKQFLVFLKDVVPSVVHECPYKVRN